MPGPTPRPRAAETREPGYPGAVEELRGRNAELEILYETIRDVTSTLSVREVLERLVDRALNHLDSEIASILLKGGDAALRMEVARGLPVDVSETVVATGEGISGWVAREGRPLLVEDIETDPRFSRRNHERYYTHSFISAPLVYHDEVRGVINVNNKRTREAFKPSDLRLLEALAGHAAVALENASRYEETLERAQRDALTGLANHGFFWSSLEREVHRAFRYDSSLALAMVDVDHFKAYNDRHGHPGGDRALVSVAGVIATLCRAPDLVARYGGEEFSVILPETSLEGAFAFGEKIRQAVAAESFGERGDDALTVSVGVAVAPREASSAKGLLRLADSRLYRAKALGRNSVCGKDDAVSGRF